MSRKTRNTIILAKIETTQGTDATPTGAANALLITEPSYTLNNEPVDRDLLRGYMGASEQLSGARNVQISFSVEVSGSGTAGTAPAYDALLRACGMGVTTDVDWVEYKPVSTAFESLTIYYYLDGVRRKALGCMGTFTLAGEVGTIPRFAFTFTGTDGGRAADPNPTPTLTAWRPPKVVSNENAGQLTLGCTYADGAISGGSTYCSKGLNLDLGNEVVYRNMLGPCSGAEIVNRAASGSIQLDLSASAEVAQFTDVIDNALTSLGLVLGTTAGSKVLFFAPAVQRINPSDQDDQGKALTALDLRLCPLVGNDELRIVVL